MMFQTMELFYMLQSLGSGGGHLCSNYAGI